MSRVENSRNYIRIGVRSVALAGILQLGAAVAPPFIQDRMEHGRIIQDLSASRDAESQELVIRKTTEGLLPFGIIFTSLATIELLRVYRRDKSFR